MIKFNFSKIFLLSFIIYFPAFSQLLFTSVDSEIGDVRACYYDFTTKEILDISSNGTYMPFWCGNEIVYNFGNHLWKVDDSLKLEQILFEGIKPVYAPVSGYLFALYQEGVVMGTLDGKIIKKFQLETWNKVSLTLTADEKYFSFYNKQRDICYLFDWKNESLIKFGKNIYHPTWSPDGNKILFNIGGIDSTFRIAVVDTGWVEGNQVKFLTERHENAIVPIWSPNKNIIAYLVLKENSQNDISDLYRGEIYFYNLSENEKIIIATDAGYTENAFPQFCFDKSGKYFYYTAINEKGKGSIVQVDLKNNFKKNKITNNLNIDYRLPYCK